MTKSDLWHVAVASASVTIVIGFITTAPASPQFARETKLACIACHTHVPRLNEFGQQFAASGFRMGGLEKHPTTPAWVQAFVAGSNTEDSERIPLDWASTKIASGGRLGDSNLLYHLSVHPVERVIEASANYSFTQRFALTFGEISMMSQSKPRLEVTHSTPRAFAPEGNFDSLTPGPFAPAGSAMAVRLTASTVSALPYGNGLNFAVTVPVENESAHDDGALARPSGRPKGAFMELFHRDGMNSIGVSAFIGRDGRRYQGAFAQRQFGEIYVQAAASHARWAAGDTDAFSLSADWLARPDTLLGMRVDCQEGETTYVPYLGFILPGLGTAASFHLESLIKRDSRPITTLSIALRF